MQDIYALQFFHYFFYLKKCSTDRFSLIGNVRLDGGILSNHNGKANKKKKKPGKKRKLLILSEALP